MSQIDMKELYSKINQKTLRRMELYDFILKKCHSRILYNSNLEWINISSLKGWDSESTDVYYVSYTPTFYLVDNQTTIVGRPDGKEDVIRMLNNLLR